MAASAPTDREMFRTLARECVAFRVQRAARLIGRAYDQALAAAGLTATQLTLLSAIANRPDLKLGEIAELIGLEQSSASRSCALLERRGLVERAPAADKRERLYQLTVEGRAVCRRAFASWAAAQERVRAQLGAAALAQLTTSLDALAGPMPHE